MSSSLKEAFAQAQKKRGPSATDTLAKLRAAGMPVEIVDNRLAIGEPVPAELRPHVRRYAPAILAILAGRVCYRCGCEARRASSIRLPDGMAIHHRCMTEDEA
jgi:hypothetical protein